jgi:ER-Golgi trafficking TRAPP I complex 85 kDa subunit
MPNFLQISHRRGGISNRLKGFFKQRTKSTYQLNTIESKIRLVADIAFLMQDYEMAYSHYKLVLHDYRADEENARTAGAYEMMGLCQALLSRDRRDVENLISNAVHNYKQVGDKNRAIRATLWLTDCFESCGKQADIPQQLVAMAFSLRPTRAALLYEQAAYAHMHAHRLRKYSLYLIMASHNFHKANMLAHAVRSYSSAIPHYEDRFWFHVEDHVRYHLGRNHFEMAQPEIAISLFLSLFGGGSADSEKLRRSCSFAQPTDRELTFVHDLLGIVQQQHKDNNSEKLRVSELPLPIIQDDATLIHLNKFPPMPSLTQLPDSTPTTAGHAASICSQTIDSTRTRFGWTAASNVKIFGGMPAPTIFDEANITTMDHHRCSYAHEPIEVVVTVRNPLTLPIMMKNVRLAAHYNNGNGNDTGADSKTSTDSKEFLAPAISQVLLEPGEEAELPLLAVGIRQGQLVIDGVLWDLWIPPSHMLKEIPDVFSLFEVFHEFRLPPVYQYRKVRSRIVASQDRNESTSISVQVPAPHLVVSELEAFPFPASIFQGECRMIILKIQNCGHHAATLLQAKCNNPAVVSVGALCTSVQDIVAKSSATAITSCMTSIDAPNGFVSLALPNSVLEPSATVFLPLWMRPARVGSHNIEILFRYDFEPDQTKGTNSQQFRLVRVMRSVEAAPLLHVATHSRGSYSAIDESILEIAVTNASSQNVHAHVEAIHLVSQRWEFESLTFLPDARSHSAADSNDDDDSGASVSDSLQLAPQDSHFWHFKCRERTAINARRQSFSFSPTGTSPPADGALTSQGDASGSSAAYQLFSSDGKTDDVVSVFPVHAMLDVTKRLKLHEITGSSGQDNLRPQSAPVHHVPLASPPSMAGGRWENHSEDVFAFDIVISWRIDQHDPTSSAIALQQPRFGVHFLPLQRRLRPVTSKMASGCPLKMGLSFSESLEHDFSGGRPLVVPVCISVFNTLQYEALEFSMECWSPTDHFSASDKIVTTRPGLSIARRFFWRGQNCVRVKRLEPKSTHIVGLEAIILQPGHYDLNRFTFTVRIFRQDGAASKSRLYVFPVQHILQVSGAACAMAEVTETHDAAECADMIGVGGPAEAFTMGTHAHTATVSDVAGDDTKVPSASVVSADSVSELDVGIEVDAAVEVEVDQDEVDGDPDDGDDNNDAAVDAIADINSNVSNIDVATQADTNPQADEYFGEDAAMVTQLDFASSPLPSPSAGTSRSEIQSTAPLSAELNISVALDTTATSTELHTSTGSGSPYSEVCDTIPENSGASTDLTSETIFSSADHKLQHNSSPRSPALKLEVDAPGSDARQSHSRNVSEEVSAFDDVVADVDATAGSEQQPIDVDRPMRAHEPVPNPISQLDNEAPDANNNNNNNNDDDDNAAP